MDNQNPSAPSRASSPVPGAIDPTVSRPGVVHVNSRHTSRYTIIGNHLAQHRGLSLTAIGLAVHIQSLPAGARVDIKTLTARFPEGEVRIAAALRELEAFGYLERTRKRLPSGQIVTHTVSYNQPGVSPASTREAPITGSSPEDVPPVPTARLVPPPPPPPEAGDPHDLEDHLPAAALLAELRRDDPRLLLSERDVHRLAPAVTAWLERGAAPEAVRRTLTASLPPDLRHPAALLAHRLAELLPPPLPAGPRGPVPLQNCESCDRAFRAAEPGRCRGCARPGALLAA
ncbi:helix-turn-helix domain-containing protein [Streptomyces sp. NPDC048479]|uniref:helix-turn-helix domain-containing protein n=1 Tax=Streptomyces sp. NPDC048479 TaxID=3154725 RepID=UPI0034350716